MDGADDATRGRRKRVRGKLFREHGIDMSQVPRILGEAGPGTERPALDPALPVRAQVGGNTARPLGVYRLVSMWSTDDADMAVDPPAKKVMRQPASCGCRARISGTSSPDCRSAS